LFYSQITFSFSHGVYCIDSIEEHASLLYQIAKKACNLERSKVPDRSLEGYFKPYIIESMEFEFVNLGPSAKKIEIEKHEQQKKKNVNLRRFENLKIAPVRNVFQDILNKLLSKVRAIKGYNDFYYLMLMGIGSSILDGCFTRSKEDLQKIGLTFLCLIV
jgi:hypothetical protein